MVSVIIPVYQVSAFVERCVCSVMAQDYPDIECIIVDDATQDDSIEKCERLISMYSGPIQFKILHHECNRGLSAARNTGTDAARGEYIYYLDGDDAITADCIGKLMKLATDNPEAEMIIGNNQRIYTNGQALESIGAGMPVGMITRSEIIEHFQNHRLPRTAWNKLIRRSFLSHHHISFREGVLFEDLLWTFYIIKYISKLCVCKDVTYHYYIRPNSIISTYYSYSAGISFVTIYDEILHNLTPGLEKVELSRYIDGFCDRYARFVKEIPAYSVLMKEYRRLSRRHRCIRVCLKLDSVLLLNMIPFGQQIVKKARVFKLNVLKRRKARVQKCDSAV